MILSVLVVQGCPNADEALANARIAASTVDGVTVQQSIVTSEEQAHAARFAGSPSFQLDGTDLFPGAGVGLSCRLYRSHATVTGCPSADEVAEALSRALLGDRG